MALLRVTAGPSFRRREQVVRRHQPRIWRTGGSSLPEAACPTGSLYPTRTDIRSSRGGHESERLHTDTADWETPVELISMVCVRADREGGGRSRVLDVDAVRDEVKSRLGTETLQLLETEPVPWRLADYCGGGLKWRTVLSESSICWRRYTIDLALDVDGVKVPDALLAALDAFDDVIAATTPHR